MRRSAGLAAAAGAVLLAAAAVTVGDADAAIPAGVCPSGAVFGNPLPPPATTATRVVGGFSFLEGPVWDARSGTLLMSDLRGAAGPDRVQPADILRFTPPATVQTFVRNFGSNGLALSVDGTSIIAGTHDERSVSTSRWPTAPGTRSPAGSAMAASIPRTT